MSRHIKTTDRAISIAPNNPKFWHSKGLAYEGKATEDLKKQDQALQEKAIECKDSYHLFILL